MAGEECSQDVPELFNIQDFNGEYPEDKFISSSPH